MIKIISTKGSFTIVKGVDVPIRCVLYTANSISEAADWLAEHTGFDSDSVEFGGYEFEFIDED